MTQISERTMVTDAALARRLERLGLTGKEDEWTDRYLLCEHLLDPPTARARQRFEAVARFSRDLIAHRWVKTRQTRESANPKRIYYLSMEFLTGRALNNNIINMAADPLIARALQREGWGSRRDPRAGAGPWSRKRRTGATRGLLHRFAGDAAVLGNGIRPSLRVRHLPAVDPGATPGGGTRQLAATS
jgi:hypothetical protein